MAAADRTRTERRPADSPGVRHQREIDLLGEVSRLLDHSLDLGKVAKPILEALSAQIGMQHATLTLLNRQTGEILIEVSHGLSVQQARRGRYKLGEGVTGKVVQSGKPIVIPRTSESPEFLDKTQRGKRPDMSFICVPIKAEQEVLGSLSADRPYAEDIDLQQDLRLLTIISSMVAQAVRLRRTLQEEQARLSEENERLRAELRDRFRPANIVGNSHEMQNVYDQIAQVSKSAASVLIEGETGTGKELAARAIHRQSAQRTKPFVVVNCAAIPRDLFESTLFGHVKGAFTGATADTPGLLALAHGGILFLDEVGDLSLDNQARNLRVVEEGAFRTVGGQTEVRLHIRVVAATNHKLEARIAEGAFRADLFHRLSGYQIHMPPLREHTQDIPALVLHFIEQARAWGKHPITGIAPEALEALCARSWPGNVRELRNCVLRAVAVSRNEVLQARDFPVLPAEGLPMGDAALLSLAEIEKRHITAVIDHFRGNLKAAAESLQIARSTLYNKISEYDIE